MAFGTMTFGGTDEHFRKLGSQQVDEATRLVRTALDAGVNLFDTADFYSAGASEEILGEALGSRRDEAIVSTKLRYPMGDGPDDGGLSRHHIIRACEASLRRLDVEHIDLLHLHQIDLTTPWEETIRALDDLVRSGKVRYLGLSNFPGWMVTKAAGISDARGWERFVCNQVHYSLLCRDIEFELVPSALDAGVGHVIWSPLSGGLLSGKFGRGVATPADSRRSRGFGDTVPVDDEQTLAILDVASDIAADRGCSVAQVAINWLITRPSVSSVVLGARTERQLIDNLGAAQWEMTADEAHRLNAVTDPPAPYPASHNRVHAADRQVGDNRRAVSGADSPGRAAQRKNGLVAD
ncbi:aldo/keto reductase [Aeromicrobium sp. UC242_57]|uniref:aldo/keto reductase n=1 Tax=Aeromicrobium sp. UC242_57 TaxID=3374624 RepID=UPI0037A7EE32